MSAVTDVKHPMERAPGGKGRWGRVCEPIQMVERRFGYFPKAFRHRGRRYAVQVVEQCWAVSRRGGRVERHCFRVRCCEGTFELYREARHNTWHLQRRVAGSR